MIIVMKENATEKQIENVIQWIESVGYKAHPSRGVKQTIIGAIGKGKDKEYLRLAESLAGVGRTMPIVKPYKLASREMKAGNTAIDINGVIIGSNRFIVMAGPCSINRKNRYWKAPTS